MDPDSIGLPIRPFLYTVDQIATLLSVEPRAVLEKYLFFEGRSTGVCPRDMLHAVNISPKGDKPDWRVAERDLIRWFRVKGFRYYDHGFVTH